MAASPGVTELVHEIRGLRNDVRALAHAVERSAMLRSPTWSIARGVWWGIFGWSVFVGVLYVTVWLLTHLPVD
jgi:hypothetical protein